MDGRELTKMVRATIAPFLSARGFIWDGFKALSYDILKESETLDKFYGSGRYLTRSKGKSIELPSYSLNNHQFSEILNATLRKYKLEEASVSFAAYGVTKEELGYREKMLNHEIYDEKSFMIWESTFRAYWENYVEPFFEKYISIKEIDKELNDLENPEWKECFAGYPYLKKLIVYKMACNPGYKEYSEWYLQHHESAKTLEGGVYLNYCLAALNLYEKLESGGYDKLIV